MSGQGLYANAETMYTNHVALIDKYIEESGSQFAEFKDEYLEVANLSLQKLEARNRDQLFNDAYLLYSYASCLQDEVNRHKIMLNWANNQLNNLVAVHKNDYGFDKYTKHEAKVPLMVAENSYAAKVDEMKLVATNKLQSLEGKIYELKKKGDILTEKAKRQ